jgi:hypothetical protein
LHDAKISYSLLAVSYSLALEFKIATLNKVAVAIVFAVQSRGKKLKANS